MIKQIYILSFLLLGLSCVSFSQDFKKDMALINDGLNMAESIHISVDVKVFSDKSKSKVIHETEGTVKRKGAKILYEMNNTLMCFNQTHSILIHEPSKKIIVGKNSKEKRAKMKETMDLGAIDSLLVVNDPKITFMGNKGGQKHYRIVYEKGTYAAVDVFLSAQKPSLKKVVYQYNVDVYPENNYVEIKYDVFDLNAQLSDEIFSNSSYFKYSKNQYFPSSKLSNYQVVQNEEY